MTKTDYLTNTAKRVAVVNDLSSFGKCSLTASLPIFSCMGIQACPLPTAVLSCQTGFEEFFKQDMTFVWDSYFDSWRKMGVKFDAIVSGYLTCAYQIKKLKEFIAEFRRKDTLFVVDPVLGDDGQLYPGMGLDMVREMNELISVADFCTPNLTELCLLNDVNPMQALEKRSTDELFSLVKTLGKKLLQSGCKAVVVTGIRHDDSVSNFVCSKECEVVTSSPSYKVNMSGSGDIFCTILTAEVLSGKTLEKAVSIADKFLTQAIRDTARGEFDNKHGLNFEKYLRNLV